MIDPDDYDDLAVTAAAVAAAVAATITATVATVVAAAVVADTNRVKILDFFSLGPPTTSFHRSNQMV